FYRKYLTSLPTVLHHFETAFFLSSKTITYHHLLHFLDLILFSF
ncbi:hypothetical protein X975_08080, partial [Stegodyphus mimosarum]